MAKESSAPEVFTLPVARVINASLFERDVYKDERTGKEGSPLYKIELAFADEDDLDDLYNRMMDIACDEWGEDLVMNKAGDDFNADVEVPFISGDRMAEKREKKKKAGDAYKGTTIIRANTLYNEDGDAGPGGIAVYGPDKSPIGLSLGNVKEMYNGCYGIAAVSVRPWVDTSGQEDVYKFKLYLSAFQKTKDGERLRSSSDHSSLFKEVGRKEGEGSSRRRSRKG